MAYGDAGTFLVDLQRVLRDTYLTDEFHEVVRPRAGFPAWINWRKLAVRGRQATYQCETRPYSGARTGALESALPDPQKSNGAEVIVNIGGDGTNGASGSHLKRLSAAIQVTEETRLVAEADGSVVNVADHLATGVKRDMIEALRAKVWQGSGAMITRQTGAALEGDGTALANGNANIIFSVDGSYGSPTQLLAGMVVDAYNTTTKRYDNAVVLDVKPHPTSEGVWQVILDFSTGTPTTVTDTNYCDGTADTGQLNLYRSGEYGVGLTGILDWFHLAADTPAGVNQIFNIDRTTVGNTWFLPTKIGNSSLSDLSLDMVDRLFPVVRREVGQPPRGLALVGDPEMTLNIRQLMLSDKISIMEMNADSSKLFGNHGADDVFFRDPLVGKVGLVADEFAPSNSLWILDPQSWGFLKLGDEMKWAPGSTGIWQELSDTTTRYLAWRADMYMFTQLLCFAPRHNWKIYNVRSVNAA